MHQFLHAHCYDFAYQINKNASLNKSIDELFEKDRDTIQYSALEDIQKMDSGYVCYLCCLNIIVHVLVLFNLDGRILFLQCMFNPNTFSLVCLVGRVGPKCL